MTRSPAEGQGTESNLHFGLGVRMCGVGLFLVSCLLIALVQSRSASAQEILTVDNNQISININEAKFLRLTQPANAIFLSNPSVAEIDLQTASYIYLVGKSVGESTLFVLGEDDEPILRTTVSVDVDADRLTRAVARSVSGGNVAVSSIDGAIFLRGVVPSPDDIATAEDVLAALTGPNAVIVNRLELEQSAQVNLQVKIAEVSRTVGDNLGFGINASGPRGSFSSPVSDIDNGFSVSVTPSGTNMNLMLDALSRRGHRSQSLPRPIRIAGDHGGPSGSLRLHRYQRRSGGYLWFHPW